MKAVGAPSNSASKTRSFWPSGLRFPSLVPTLSTFPLFAAKAKLVNLPFVGGGGAALAEGAGLSAGATLGAAGGGDSAGVADAVVLGVAGGFSSPPQAVITSATPIPRIVATFIVASIIPSSADCLASPTKRED